MKGFIEEYGTFIITAITAIILISFIVFESTSPTGIIHRLFVGNMENMGVETQTIVEEWDVGTINVKLKDDGGLYFTGTGTLPTYNSVEVTPWADQTEYISFVDVSAGVTVNGTIPIK